MVVVTLGKGRKATIDQGFGDDTRSRTPEAVGDRQRLLGKSHRPLVVAL
jgi:hypothetical protein